MSRAAEGFQAARIEADDPALPGLAGANAQPGARVLVYRPGRRVVLVVPAAHGPEYIKVVRPKRLPGIVARARRVERLRLAAVPRVLAVDESAGTIRLSSAGGRSLHDAGADPTTPPALLERAWRTAGHAVAELHELDPDGLPFHGAEEELGAIDKALYAAGKALDRHAVADARARVSEALRSGSSPTGVLHRDLHDKQLLLPEPGSGQTRIGLIDVDTLAVGERALDIANLLAHLDLRRRQGLLAPARAARAADAFRETACRRRDSGPGTRSRRGDAVSRVEDRVRVHLDAARLRLAGVYAGRAGSEMLARGLLADVLDDRGADPLWTSAGDPRDTPRTIAR